MISRKAFHFVRKMSNYVIKNNSFDQCLQKLKTIKIGDGRFKAEFQVTDEHLNRAGVLHGGFTSCVIDTVTSEILLTRENCPFCVSTDLHVTFMKGARKGDEVLIDANTTRSGRSFAFLECELRHKRDNSLIARGIHTVYFPAEQKK